MSSKVPVLLITFNRPDLAIRVVDQIRLYKPDVLYVASDGARPQVEGESKLVEETRNKVLEAIDWPCQVNTLFRDANVGCGAGPSSAISWMFETEEFGIILEDDCIPQYEFFSYCEYLLTKYKDEQRVWVVSGRSDYGREKYFRNADYVFTNYAITWGWATWKRCWDRYDINMATWDEFLAYGGFKNIFHYKPAGLFMNLKYQHIIKDKELSSHVWDYQFNYCMKLNGGLAILPAKNLIENVGYEGTHFSGMTQALKLKSEQGFKIEKEPGIICLNRRFERNCFYKSIKSKFVNRITGLFAKA